MYCKNCVYYNETDCDSCVLYGDYMIPKYTTSCVAMEEKIKEKRIKMKRVPVTENLIQKRLEAI